MFFLDELFYLICFTLSMLSTSEDVLFWVLFFKRPHYFNVVYTLGSIVMNPWFLTLCDHRTPGLGYFIVRSYFIIARVTACLDNVYTCFTISADFCLHTDKTYTSCIYIYIALSPLEELPNSPRSLLPLCTCQVRQHH